MTLRQIQYLRVCLKTVIQSIKMKFTAMTFLLRANTTRLTMLIELRLIFIVKLVEIVLLTLHFNVRSLPKNIDKLSVFVEQLAIKPDVIAITYTK